MTQFSDWIDGTYGDGYSLRSEWLEDDLYEIRNNPTITPQTAMQIMRNWLEAAWEHGRDSR